MFPKHSRFALVFLTGLLPAAMAPAQQEMPSKQVGVVEVRLQDVPHVVTLPGRAVSGAAAGIRPQVSGTIEEILYSAGTAVKAGTPMFRLDATTYEAKVKSAQAEVASARASVLQATSAYERASRLVGAGATQAEVENTKSTLEQAEARVQVAEAALDVARAELGWTVIRSPIDGMASVASVSLGDLVTASQSNTLATVTRLDPIDVDMYEPSVRILSVFDDIQAGQLKVHKTLKATLTLENGTTYDATGELLAPGFTVSTTTGAVDNRFRFENPEQRLLPGMFVRGRIEMGVTRAFLVSQSAATRDRTGKLTAFVVKDGKVAQKELTDNGTWQHQWIVTKGLEEGDLLVADGLMGLVAGMSVTTVPVRYDDSGVVRDAGAAAEPATGTKAE